MADVTRILEAIDCGDAQAAKDLLPLVYRQLRALAAERLAHEAPGQTLQATALVHEAYLRLTGGPPDAGAGAEEQQENPRESPRFANRAHFFAAAAESMRRVLVEIARRKKRRRNLAAQESPAEQTAPDAADRQLDLIALDEALTELAREDPRKAKLIELRFFAGLPEAEAAGILGISSATAARDWAFARAWLYRKLHQGPST